MTKRFERTGHAPKVLGNALRATQAPPERAAAVLADSGIRLEMSDAPDDTDVPDSGLIRDAGVVRDAVEGEPVPTASRALSTERTVTMPAAPAFRCGADGRIIEVTDELADLCGPGMAGFVGRELIDVLSEGDPAELSRPGAEPIPVRVTSWPIAGDQRVVLVTDVSDLVLVEAASRGLRARLTQERRRLEDAQRVARMGTWEWDPHTGVTVFSSVLCELYGLAPDTRTTYDTYLDLVHPEDRAWVNELWQQFALDKMPVDCQHRLVRPDGERRVVRCHGEVITGDDGRRFLGGSVQDVTETVDTEARIKNVSQRFADLFGVSPVGIGIFDQGEQLVEANAALCQLLGYDLEQLRKMTSEELTHPENAEEIVGPSAHIMAAGEKAYKIPQRILRRSDGQKVYCELHIVISMQDDGRRFWLVVFQDITDRRRAAEALKHQVSHDDLTGLPNRAAIKETLRGLLVGPEAHKVAVLFCDVDNFKRVNDSLGHDAGDEVLVALARRLEGGLPPGCTPARLSGDEYVVICADIEAAGGVDALANKVSALMRTAIPVHGQMLRVSASIGAAIPSSSLSGGDDLLRFADAAMFEAKRRGAGRVSLASAALMANADRQVHLEGQLREALSRDGLTLHFQPVVSGDGRVLTAEALVRWPHPDRGLLSPDVFLPVAEQGDLLRDLDLWVLRTALREAVGWSTQNGRPVGVAVNLAGLVPGDAEFVEEVTEAVTDSGIEWDRVVLELVETSFVDLPSRTRHTMGRLVDKGVRFAVDDFGTGYSSLARLKDLPAQIVKVDRRFVAGVGNDPSDFAVARAVVDMARAMGRSCVAEGVETATQFHVLRGVGVDAYQGWLFSRALPVRDFRALLERGPLNVPRAG